VNLVWKVGETDETHKFLANHWRRGIVRGSDEGRVGWASIAILREGVAVAAGIVRHLSEERGGGDERRRTREKRKD
jgi:hypothetical protein